MNQLYKNREWLDEKYTKERLSCVSISKILGCGDKTIHRWLIKHDIPRRKLGDYDKSGAKNHNWKGGISNCIKEFRHSEEYKEWQEKVRSRDKWMCKIELLRPEVDLFPHKGDVAHHIFNVRDNWEKRYDVNNGLCLCKSCHNKVHIRNGGEEGVSREQKIALYDKQKGKEQL